MARKLRIRTTVQIPDVDRHTVSITRVIDARKEQVARMAQNLLGYLENDNMQIVRPIAKNIPFYVGEIETLQRARDIMQSYYLDTPSVE